MKNSKHEMKADAERAKKRKSKKTPEVDVSKVKAKESGPYRSSSDPNRKVKLGDIARDKLSGYTGVAIARSTLISNCPRITLQSPNLHEGKPISPYSLDEPSLEFVSESDHVVWEPARPEEQVELGDEVQDSITKLQGVCVGHTIWSNGCSRILVQMPGLKPDGTPFDASTYDEKDAIIVKRANPPKPILKTGGPRAEPVRN